jgi:ParB-like chromosome segregation protein Spo0J
LSVRQLAIVELPPTRRIQLRERSDASSVEDIAEFIKRGGKLDPVTVYKTESGLLLVDGNHRLAAHEAVGVDRIAARVIPGTDDEAWMAAAAANANHGLRRTNADKRRAVEVVLKRKTMPHPSHWRG